MTGWTVAVSSLVLAACGRVAFEPTTDAGATTVDLVRYPLDTAPVAERLPCNVPGQQAVCLPGACPTAIAGKIGGAIHFTGAEAMYLPWSDLAGAHPFTVALWFSPEGTGTRTLVAKPTSAGSSANVLSLLVDGSGLLTFETAVSDIGFNLLPATVAVTAPGWHHVAATWDGAIKRVFVDGAPAGAAQPPTFYDALHPIYLGTDIDMDVGHAPFVGGLDDLRFYARALDDAEVAALAQ